MRTRTLAFVIAAIVLAPAAGVSASGGWSDEPVDSVGAAAGGLTTSVLGAAWHSDNSPIPGAHLRLRNVMTGRIEATAIANTEGRFTFESLERGTYLVELVADNGKILTVGHPFTVEPGETVATFVRLGTKVPWMRSFFANTAAAAAASAASEGITAIAPVARPASAGQ
ncbi:MAG: carboxypeptidase-like regulatory domain-containing protein [Vicinamibacterales bacterium]